MNTPEARIAALPEPIRKHVDPKDPYWCYVPDGWVDLVVRLNEELEAIDPNYTLDQSKEKFGGLRYYCTMSDEYADNYFQFEEVITKYENEAYSVCIVCGEPAEQVVIAGYVQPYCELHEKETRQRYEERLQRARNR